MHDMTREKHEHDTETRIARSTYNEDLLIYVFYKSLTGIAAQWYTKLKKDQIRT